MRDGWAAGAVTTVIVDSPAANFASPAAPCRVLCIDDDPVSRLILVGALVRSGFAVECVCDGQEALERYARDAGGFDVLVTDHQMPRLDGLALVGRLRACGFVGGVVVVSGSLTRDIRDAYRALGAGALLNKPIEPAALRAAVDAAAAVLPRARSMISASRASRSPFPNHTSP